MRAFDIPQRRGPLTFGTLTMHSLPKRFIDATMDYDPNLDDGGEDVIRQI